MLSRRVMCFSLTGVLTAPAIVRTSSLDRLSRKSNLLRKRSIIEVPFPDEIKWDLDAVDGIRITAMRFHGSETWIPVTGHIPLEFADAEDCDFSRSMFQNLA